MMGPDNSDTSLADAREGDTLEMVRITGEGALKQRLPEMGMVSGVIAKIVKYAPLMDPMEIVVIGTHTSIRVAEAARIMIKHMSDSRITKQGVC